MNTLFIIGRIAFVLVFILSGAQKLMDIPGTAAMIEPKVAIPEADGVLCGAARDRDQHEDAEPACDRRRRGGDRQPR